MNWKPKELNYTPWSNDLKIMQGIRINFFPNLERSFTLVMKRAGHNKNIPLIRYFLNLLQIRTSLSQPVLAGQNCPGMSKLFKSDPTCPTCTAWSSRSSLSNLSLPIPTCHSCTRTMPEKYSQFVICRPKRKLLEGKFVHTFSDKIGEKSPDLFYLRPNSRNGDPAATQQTQQWQ